MSIEVLEALRDIVTVTSVSGLAAYAVKRIFDLRQAEISNEIKQDTQEKP